MSTPRKDGRAPHELRKIELHTDYTKWAEGSVLACFGDTKVLCTATIDDRVPPWLEDKGRGWITAEYAMLPRSTGARVQRESVRGKIGGRTHEISRLIGRALRAGIDLANLGKRTVTIDCDVLQADGGTRTASITGGFTALALALRRLSRAGKITRNPIRNHVAAVSLGIIGGEVLMDLDFREDESADTDMNLVMTDAGGLVEIQGTAEKSPFSTAELDAMVVLGRAGIETLVCAQRAALELAK